MNIINFIGLSFDKQGFCGEQQFPAMYQQLTKNFLSIAVLLPIIAVHKKTIAVKKETKQAFGNLSPH